MGGRGSTCIGQPADQFEKPDPERDSRHPLYDERSLDEIVVVAVQFTAHGFSTMLVNNPFACNE